jgi:hypothetical protein
MDNTNPNDDMEEPIYNEDLFLQENWPEWVSDPEADYGDPYLDGEMHQDPNEMYDE